MSAAAGLSTDLVDDLTRVDPGAPGWSRRRRGRGFSYHDERGRLLTDPEALARIRALVIPPAWREVWISPLEDGHIQAVGTDDAGRRQYRYHDEWRRARDAAKHQRVLALGRRMPRVRREVAHRLAEPGLGQRRVLAAAVRMLDIGVFRPGGEQYAPSCDDDEGTFGLATLPSSSSQVGAYSSPPARNTPMSSIRTAAASTRRCPSPGSASRCATSRRTLGRRRPSASTR